MRAKVVDIEQSRLKKLWVVGRVFSSCLCLGRGFESMYVSQSGHHEEVGSWN